MIVLVLVVRRPAAPCWRPRRPRSCCFRQAASTGSSRPSARARAALEALAAAPASAARDVGAGRRVRLRPLRRCSASSLGAVLQLADFADARRDPRSRSLCVLARLRARRQHCRARWRSPIPSGSGWSLRPPREFAIGRALPGRARAGCAVALGGAPGQLTSAARRPWVTGAEYRADGERRGRRARGGRGGAARGRLRLRREGRSRGHGAAHRHEGAA